jgi:hypothetical protein
MNPASGRQFTIGGEPRPIPVDSLPARGWPAGIIVRATRVKPPMQDFLLPTGKRGDP